MRNLASFLGFAFLAASQSAWTAEAPSIAPIPPQSAGEGTSLIIPLDILDADSAAETLQVKASSDLASLIPGSDLTVKRDGSAFSLQINPAPNQVGTANLTVLVTDPTGLSASRSFPVTVTPVNYVPELTPLQDQAILEGTSTPALTFFVADVESSFEQLTTSGLSSNPTLIPASNILFSGTGFERKVIVKPAANEFGEATVTVVVSDPGGKSGKTSFKVTVTPLNQAPTISPIEDVQVDLNTGATVAVPFRVTDKETPPDFLLVSLSSSNGDLLPQSLMSLGGDGEFRVIRFTPAPGKIGDSTITVTVRDLDGRTARSNFRLKVLAAGPPPTLADFNGDGLGDLVFQHQDGFIATSFLDNWKLTGSSFFTPNHPGDADWELITTADFNGDSNPDLLFQHRDGTIASWQMNGVQFAGASLFTPAKPNEDNWRVVSVADIYSDGTRDLILQNSDGRMAAWLMNGTTLVNNTLLSPPRVADTAWKIVGTADLNRDGNPDLVFQHTDGTLGAWFMSGLRMIQTTLLEPGHPGDSGWRVASLQDFDRDGKTDLLFQHTDGSLGIWYMDGIKLRASTLVSPANPGQPWRVIGPK